MLIYRENRCRMMWKGRRRWWRRAEEKMLRRTRIEVVDIFDGFVNVTASLHDVIFVTKMLFQHHKRARKNSRSQFRDNLLAIILRELFPFATETITEIMNKWWFAFLHFRLDLMFIAFDYNVFLLSFHYLGSFDQWKLCHRRQHSLKTSINAINWPLHSHRKHSISVKYQFFDWLRTRTTILMQ